MVTREENAAAYEQLEPFSKICLPERFDQDDSGTVVLSDMTLGMAWIMDPIAATPLTGHDKNHIAKHLSGAMGRLEGVVRLQFIIMPSRNIEDQVENYLAQGGTKNAVYAELERSKADFYRKSVDGLGVRSADLNFSIKSVRIMVTLVVEGSESIGDLASAAKDALRTGRKMPGIGRLETPQMAGDLNGIPGVQRWAQSYSEMKSRLLSAAQTIESSLAGIVPAVNYRRAKKDEFIRYYQAMVHVDSSETRLAKYVNTEPLPEQLVRHEVHLHPNGLIKSNGYYHGVLSVDGMPDNVLAGMLSEPHPNLAFNSLIDYVVDGVICINISLPDKEVIQDWITKRYNLANEGDGDPIERQVIIDECLLLRQLTKNEGRRVVDFQINVSMTAKEPHLVQARLALVRRKLMELGFRARIEESAASSFWSHCLPFGWKPSMPGAKRTKRRIDLVVASLLPIYLMGRGTKSKAFMALNKRGEPTGFDIFESRSAFNTAVVAESGGGKSVAINAIIADYARNDKYQAIIIDIGGSYRPQIENLGEPEGKYVGMIRTEKRASAFNCFDGTFEMTSSTLLKWLNFLASPKGQDLDPLVLGKVAKALRVAFDKKLRRDVPYRTLKELLDTYPDYHIARSAKRIRVKPLSDDEIKNLSEVKQSMTSGTEIIRFEIFYLVRITGSVDKSGRSDQLNLLQDLTKREQLKLLNDFPYVEEDERGVFVLTRDQNAVRSLSFDGYVCQVERDYMVVEAADRKDFAVLHQAGVKVIMDDAYLAKARTRILDGLEAKYGSRAKPEMLRTLCEEALAQEEAMVYFDQVEGRADLQEQVFFREFAQVCFDTKDRDLEDVATRLAPYYGDGAYAGYFDQPTSLSLNGKRIVCWDFEDLMKGDTKLVGALLGALFQTVVSYATSPRSDGKRKQIIIDEYRKFQEASYIVDTFTDEVARQGRKYGFGVCIGTQSINDLKNARTNLLEQIQHYLIGVQIKSVIQEMEQTLGLNFEQRAAISSIFNRKGVWSEFVLLIPGAHIFETLRIVLDPILYWTFSSDAPDKKERNKKKNHYAVEVGYTPKQAMMCAIRECANEWPRGIAHHRQSLLK